MLLVRYAAPAFNLPVAGKRMTRSLLRWWTTCLLRPAGQRMLTASPFMPDGWAASAGGFPAMTGNVPFLMKDVVLLAASFYLLKQDVMRVSLSTSPMISAPKVGRGEMANSQIPRTAEEACCAVT